jgi:hypothetical protein
MAHFECSDSAVHSSSLVSSQADRRIDCDQDRQTMIFILLVLLPYSQTKMSGTEETLIEAMRAVALSYSPTISSKATNKHDNANKVDLEKLILTPDHRLSEAWLNKLQQSSALYYEC